jgi:hypothetical protein
MSDVFDRLKRLPWSTILLVGAGLVVVTAHVVAAWGSVAPLYYTDEVGYIANAQLIAGVGEPRSFSASSYYVGWSFVLVPLWWMSHDPQFIYQAGVGLSVACGVLVSVPLAFIARRLGLSMPWAFIAGAAVAVAPSRLVMSNFALAENFIALLTATTAIAALRFVEHKSPLRAVVLISLASYLLITHARTGGVLVGAVVLIVLTSWRSWRVLVPSFASAAVIVGTGFAVYARIVPLMYADAAATREERGVDRLLSLDPFAALTTSVGQLWYSTTAWFGLALLGLIVVVAAAIRELKSRAPGVAVSSVVATLGLVGVSVVWITAAVARDDARYDIYAYGRYLDTFLGIFAIVGLVTVARGLSKRLALRWLIATVAVIGAFFAIVVWQVPTVNAWWGPNSVPGLLEWDWPQLTPVSRPPWIIASLAAFGAVALATLTRLGRRRHVRQATVVIVALSVFLAAGAVAEVKTITRWSAPWYTSFTLRDNVTSVLAEYPAATLSFDDVGLSRTLFGTDTVSRNAYQFWLSPRALPVFTSSEESPTTDLVISRKEWPAGEALGARIVAEDTGMFNNALWVLPGELQDEMAAAGELGG